MNLTLIPADFSDKSLNATAIVNHNRQTLTIKQDKEIIVLDFKQFKELLKGVDFYNSLSQITV